MSIRTIIGGALSLALTTTVAFAACRGPKPGPVLHAGPASSAASSATAAPTLAGDVSAPSSNTASVAPAPEDNVAAAVAAARSCTAPTSRIANQPDGGLVFVNAWRRQDAGNIDRLQGIVDAISTQSHVFRCCFDVWAAANPNKDGKLMLKMELAPEGAVTSASIDKTRSDLEDAVTYACVIDVAKGLTYPPSPSSSATLVEYPFAVSSR